MTASASGVVPVESAFLSRLEVESDEEVWEGREQVRA